MQEQYGTDQQFPTFIARFEVQEYSHGEEIRYSSEEEEEDVGIATELLEFEDRDGGVVFVFSRQRGDLH